jgi:hypothetical protein
MSKQKIVRTPTIGKVYLTAKEIEYLENITFVGIDKKRLDQTRDVFLAGYYIGQRYGFQEFCDKNQLNATQTALKMEFLYNVEIVTIPVCSKFLAIMERYEWRLPMWLIDDFIFNFREVCLRAGFDRMFMFFAPWNYPKHTFNCSMLTSNSYAINHYLSNPYEWKAHCKIAFHSYKLSLYYLGIDNEEHKLFLRDFMNTK